MEVFQPVVFRLDKELYGLDISSVEAIENRQDVVRVPNASPNIKGIINLRGEVIPVISMRVKFGLSGTDYPDNESFIIVRTGGRKIALEVDGVEEIHTIDMDNITDMPPVTLGNGVDYLTKVAKAGDKLIIIVNPDHLLSTEEVKIAEQLTEI